jgi:hypothetical protein
MMTVKADDIEGRHQAYADIVQGRNISTNGRTAAFDGLCCEIRGLGFEVTLGKIVDTFELIEDRNCVAPKAKSLEQKFMVSRVDKLEQNDGTKTLEIPAGDYEPATIPSITPELPPMIYGHKRIQQIDPLLETSLIDDLEEDEVVLNTKSDLDEVGSIELPLEHKDNILDAESKSNNLVSINSKNLQPEKNYDDLEKILENGFPSLNNWESLANDLINIGPDAVPKKAPTSTVMKRMEAFVEDFSKTNNAEEADPEETE